MRSECVHSLNAESVIRALEKLLFGELLESDTKSASVLKAVKEHFHENDIDKEKNLVMCHCWSFSYYRKIQAVYWFT